jgi:hypothetical protein
MLNKKILKPFKGAELIKNINELLSSTDEAKRNG